jgi:hypothetical protein
MFIIYNCGYRSAITLTGISGKKYAFKKRFVTEVEDKDGKELLKMDYKGIPWCPTNSKLIPPFMKVEDWCQGKEGRFDYKPFKIYDSEDYKKKFLLK